MFNDQIKRPTVPQLKGRAKIQVFNGDGSIDNEVKTNNFIYPGIEHVMTHSVLNVLGLNTERQESYAEKLVLMFDDKKGGEDSYSDAGATVGFAMLKSPRTPDEWRGTLNNEESFKTHNLIRFVLDFPTQTANGVFNSLVVTRGGRNAGGAFSGYTGVSFGRDSDTFSETGDYVRAISTGEPYDNPFFVAEFRKGIFKCNGLTGEVQKLSGEGVGNDHAALLDGKIYKRYSSGSRTLEMWSLSGDKLKEVSIEGIYRIEGVGTDGKVIYVSASKTYNGLGILKTFRSDLTEIDSVELAELQFGGVYFRNGRLYVGGGRYVEGEEHFHGDALSTSEGKTRSGDYAYFDKRDFGVGVLSDSLKVTPPYRHLSRINLDSEIEKRKGQTMKVTYEYEYVNPYDLFK